MAFWQRWSMHWTENPANGVRAPGKPPKEFNTLVNNFVDKTLIIVYNIYVIK